MRPLFLFFVLLMATSSLTLRAQEVKDSLPKTPKEAPVQREPAQPNRTPAETLPARPQLLPKTAETYRMANRTRRRVPGYRIQVYTGDNTRRSKQRALDLKAHIQQLFPELSVYIHFQSPRWICRVGDFISRAEAQPYLKKIRRHNISPEASIVACPVLRAY